MGAGVQEDDAAAGCGLDGREHAIEIKTFGFCAEVGICFHGQVYIGEDLVVVGPSWGGNVDSWRGLGEEFGEEEAAEMDCASARDGLEGDGLFVTVLEDLQLIRRLKMNEIARHTRFSLTAGLSAPRMSF